MNTLRPLSAYSYGMLLKHACPCIEHQTDDKAERIRAAVMWHFVHTAGIDQLERMDAEQFKAAVAAHGYALPPNVLPSIFTAMTEELAKMNEAFVEVESDDIANFPTTATSQTSSTH